MNRTVPSALGDGDALLDEPALASVERVDPDGVIDDGLSGGACLVEHRSDAQRPFG